MEELETSKNQTLYLYVRILLAIILGFFGILFIAGMSKIAPTLAKQDILAHQLGIGIFFYFFLICLFLNPLLGLISRKLQFGPKELSIIMIMVLTAGGFAWTGWMKQLYTQTVNVAQEEKANTLWDTYKILKYANKKTFVNDTVSDETVIGGFTNGLYQKEWINPIEAKNFLDNFFTIFRGWNNLIYWVPLILLVSLMSLAMLMIVNKQWIRNEKLTYPIAAVAESLYAKTDSKSYFSDLFRNNLFWISFFFVFLIHLYNFLVAAYPTSGFGTVNLTYSLSGLETTFPKIQQAGCLGLLNVKIIFVIIGLAYFLAPALSLSIGLNAFIYLLFAVEVYGITAAAPIDQGLQALRAGAYIGFFIMLIILGRRYYGPIMLKAITFGKVPDEDRPAVFGARLFILSALGTVFILTSMGMDLPMALVLTLIIIIVYLVFTRIICEAGIPVMLTPFQPLGFLSKMFGGAMIGPKNLLAGGSVTGVLFGDMKQLLMPYMATGFKMTTDAGLKVRRIAFLVFISVIIAFAVAFIAHLWQYYSLGISDAGSLQNGGTWKIGINEAFLEIRKLFINEQLDQVAKASFRKRLSFYSPDSEVNVYFLIGLALVFVTGFLRTRFLWWPFHAVIFCIWNTTPANTIWASFLLGWFMRSMVVRFGGEQNYHKMKPFFFGLIYGEVCAAGVMLLYGLCYYFITGMSTTINYKILWL